MVLYRSIFDVVRDFLHDETLGGDEKVLAKYLKPDLVIIDDMGMKQLPKRSGEYLFEIIMRRYETRSTMMTSNRPLEDWGKLPVLKRPIVAGFEAPRDTANALRTLVCVRVQAAEVRNVLGWLLRT